MLLLPLWILWKLELKIKQRFRASVIFAVGIMYVPPPPLSLPKTKTPTHTKISPIQCLRLQHLPHLLQREGPSQRRRDLELQRASLGHIPRDRQRRHRRLDPRPAAAGKMAARPQRRGLGLI